METTFYIDMVPPRKERKMANAVFEVEWHHTSKWCLCHGYWIITRNGKDVSYIIPKGLRRCPMDTYGTYRRWVFEHGLETWKTYKSGFVFDEWIRKHHKWVYEICDNNFEAEELYRKIQEKDWRERSCGGCI